VAASWRSNRQVAFRWRFAVPSLVIDEGVNGLLVAKCQYHAFARITFFFSLSLSLSVFFFFLFVYLFHVPFRRVREHSDARTTISPRTFQRRWLKQQQQQRRRRRQQQQQQQPAAAAAAATTVVVVAAGWYADVGQSQAGWLCI